MPSHMVAQTTAAERNRQAEFLVDFAFRVVLNRLHHGGYLANAVKPELQRDFQRDDCSDVFDHFAELTIKHPQKDKIDGFQLWGQTTCYKGNVAGKAEANKTYEIRETIVESLVLRKHLLSEGVPFGIFHVTFGPSTYSYGWFKTAKEKSFDLSLYPFDGCGKFTVYEELALIFASESTIHRVRQKLMGLLSESKSGLSEFLCNLVNSLYEWGRHGFTQNEIANAQARLLSANGSLKEKETAIAISDSLLGGQGIKPGAQELLSGSQCSDPLMKMTVSLLTSSNPFLAAAIEAIDDWEQWSIRAFRVPSTISSLGSYIRHLWSLPSKKRLVSRRNLLRISAGGTAEYIQDLGVEGVTEHNLYCGDHNESQTEAIVDVVLQGCRRQGLQKPEQLNAAMVSKQALNLTKDALRFESNNGTGLKPSFYYVEQAISERYRCVKRKDTPLPKLVGYQREFGNERVREYSNLKVIIRKSGFMATMGPVAIIKAKYFRRQELPRRAKEESYVGLTTKYTYRNGRFEERFPGLPLIMFVDMDQDLVPPEYPIRLLVNAGWKPVFSTEKLLTYLDSLQPWRAGR